MQRKEFVAGTSFEEFASLVSLCWQSLTPAQKAEALVVDIETLQQCFQEAQDEGGQTQGTNSCVMNPGFAILLTSLVVF